jgi:ATP-dependent RNA helicase RhlE
MKDPVTIEVARRNTPAELVGQVAHPVASDRKRELLAHLVKSNDWKQVLVFCRTKHGANRLAQQLERSGIQADAIHGNKSQNARTRALEQFKEGNVRVLVATDIAARGLDIEALPHVVNYDLPHVAEDYVHRIGRTGRAGIEGEAVSLVSPEERPLLAAIERLINRRVEQRAVAGFEVGSASQEPREPRPQPRREQQKPRREPQQRRAQQQPKRDSQPRHSHSQPRNAQQPPRRGQQHPRPGARRNGNGGYVSPELEAQLREGRQRAREDAAQHPAERAEPAPAPAPKPAPTVTHRASRGLRRVLGSLLGNGNKTEGS